MINNKKLKKFLFDEELLLETPEEKGNLSDDEIKELRDLLKSSKSKKDESHEEDITDASTDSSIKNALGDVWRKIEKSKGKSVIKHIFKLPLLNKVDDLVIELIVSVWDAEILEVDLIENSPIRGNKVLNILRGEAKGITSESDFINAIFGKLDDYYEEVLELQGETMDENNMNDSSLNDVSSSFKSSLDRELKDWCRAFSESLKFYSEHQKFFTSSLVMEELVDGVLQLDLNFDIVDYETVENVTYKLFDDRGLVSKGSNFTEIRGKDKMFKFLSTKVFSDIKNRAKRLLKIEHQDSSTRYRDESNVNDSFYLGDDNEVSKSDLKRAITEAVKVGKDNPLNTSSWTTNRAKLNVGEHTIGIAIRFITTREIELMVWDLGPSKRILYTNNINNWNQSKIEKFVLQGIEYGFSDKEIWGESKEKGEKMKKYDEDMDEQEIIDAIDELEEKLEELKKDKKRRTKDKDEDMDEDLTEDEDESEEEKDLTDEDEDEEDLEIKKDRKKRTKDSFRPFNSMFRNNAVSFSDGISDDERKQLHIAKMWEKRGKK